jgi:phage-related protein
MYAPEWFVADMKSNVCATGGFIKKTRTTPDEDLRLARKRQKELEP